MSKENFKKVIIDFTETEDCTLTPDNEVAEIKVSGVVSIINPSEKNRIWNVKLKLDNIEGTSISENELNVGEVDVKSQWSKNYNVEAEYPLLKVQEIIDTAPQIKSSVPHTNLAYGITTNVIFTIKLTNVSDAHITDIQVLKSLPAAFGQPEIEKPTAGKVTFHPKNREIIWKDFELYPNGDVELKFKVEITPEKGEPYSGGPLTVTYVAESKTRSSLTPLLLAETSAYVGGSEEEDPRQPNRWICVFDFNNDSDYPLRVNRATVMQVFSDGKKDVLIEEYPNTVVNPGETWEKEYSIESPEPPILERYVDYSVEFDIHRKVIGHIEKQPKPLPVAKVDAELRFMPPEVDAYTKTPTTAILTITNTGSALLDEISSIVDLPRDFKPPAEPDVSMSKGDTPIQNVQVTVVPSDDDPTKPHTITITASDLISTIGGVQPGEGVVCEFPVISWSPRPMVDYITTYKIKANASPPIEPTIFEGESVKIGIRYVRRRLSVFKTVQPGKNPGEYIIPIKFVNNGEVAVENVTLSDFIPPGYEVVSWEPTDLEPNVEKTEEGATISWTFKRIEKGNQILLKYVIKGEGPYVRREPKYVTTGG